jgi:hypothetical protein
MRLEMMGTGFTAQHSDSRVLEHLLYKWEHSRAVMAEALVDKFLDMVRAGWLPTQDEVRRDVDRLLGGSYHEFLDKPLSPS